jgi:hypothetical protein
MTNDYASITYFKEDEKEVSSKLKPIEDFGLDILYMSDSLPSPEHEEKIKNSDIFIPFLTNSMVNADACRKDIFIAAIKNVPILPIYLKETDVDDTLLNAFKQQNPIMEYMLNDDEYSDMCRRRLKILMGKGRYKPLKYLKRLLFPESQEPNVMNLLYNPTRVYLSFSHENIDVVFEDIPMLKREAVVRRYDPETDFNEEPDEKWKKETSFAIAISSLLIFYATKNSMKSKKRIFEVTTAIAENKPVGIICLEDIEEFSDMENKIERFKINREQYNAEFKRMITPWMK